MHKAQFQLFRHRGFSTLPRYSMATARKIKATRTSGSGR